MRELGKDGLIFGRLRIVLHEFIQPFVVRATIDSKSQNG
jgi:hypothetical protein